MESGLKPAALNRGEFRMAFHHGGEGTAVFLLHGFGLDHRSMADLASTLSDRYRVILPEWRGHGATRTPARPDLYRYEYLRDDLKELLDALKIDRVHVVGHSMGGQIGLMLALDEPDRVLSLTMLGAGACRPVTTEPEINKWNAAAEYYETASAPKLLRALCAMSTVSEAASRKPPLAQLYSKARNGELAAMIRGGFLNVQGNEAACASLKPPALIMAGVEDRDWFDQAQRLSRLIPNSRWAAVPNAGHLPHLEQPEAISRLIGQFLDLTSKPD